MAELVVVRRAARPQDGWEALPPLAQFILADSADAKDLLLGDARQVLLLRHVALHPFECGGSHGY